MLPEVSRALPVEVDDSINYMLRGAQIKECPLQDCRALEDLREQVRPRSTDPERYAAQLKEYTRLFVQHTPLHAAALAGLNGLGLGWVDAYTVMKAVGVGILVAGTALWLLALFGWVAAGWGVVLVALTYFVGQGYIWVVPGSMSMGLTMIAWAFIARSGRRHWGLILLLIVLSMLMHTMGRGFAVLSVVAYVAMVGRPRDVREWLVIVGGIGAVLAYTAAGHLVDRPVLSPPLAAPDILVPAPLDVIKDNILAAPRIVGRTVDMVGGLVPALMVVLLTILVAERSSKVALITFLVLLGGLAGVALLHLWPRIPAELFTRLWLPLAVLLTGMIADLSTRLAVGSYAQVGVLRAGGAGPEIADERTLLTPKGWMAFLVLGATVVLAGFQTYHVAKGLYAHHRARIMTTGRHDYAFDASQVERIFADDGSCGDIAYANEWVMHAYFLHGAMRCGATFLPFAREVGAKQPTFRRAPDYVVTFNPIRQWRGTVRISGASALSIADVGDAAAPAPVRVLIENPGPATQLRVSVRPAGETATVDIVAGARGWIELPEMSRGPATTIDVRTVGPQLSIAGVRRGDTDGLHWPWNQGLELSFDEAVRYQYDKRRLVKFSTRTVFPANLDVEVVDDDGFSVLARVIRLDRD